MPWWTRRHRPCGNPRSGTGPRSRVQQERRLYGRSGSEADPGIMTKLRSTDKEFEDLSAEECRILLNEHHVGRLAYLDTAGVFPLILPVNYLLLGNEVAFRTDPGSKLRAAVNNTPVAFEVDGVDAQLEVGWSVLVRGYLSEVTDQAQLDRLRKSPLHAWAPGAKAHYLRLTPRQLTGRQIIVSPLPSDWWG
jgi:nitroimidazol reductase NimA-like FMN-containing flavoprotein (pyridoxamine 5'-phosphate oxidase superfamily)